VSLTRDIDLPFALLWGERKEGLLTFSAPCAFDELAADKGKLRRGTCEHVGDYGKIYAVRARAKQIPRGGETEGRSERLCRYCELDT